MNSVQTNIITISSTNLLSNLKLLRAKLLLPIKSKDQIHNFLQAITQIFQTPGLFLFLQHIIIKSIARVRLLAQKMRIELAQSFQRIINDLQKSNSKFLYGSILKKQMRIKCNTDKPKLEKKQVDGGIQLLSRIQADMQKLKKNLNKQISQKFEWQKQFQNIIKNFKDKSQIKKISLRQLHKRPLQLASQKLIINNHTKLIKIKENHIGIDLRKDRKGIEDQLKRRTVALLNEGGGYIFLADIRSDLINGVSGDSFQEYKQIFLKIKQEFIFPSSFHLSFEILNLYQKNVEKENEKALKINVFPQDWKLYFVSTVSTSQRQNGMSGEFLDKFLNSQEWCLAKTFTLSEKQSIYDMMLKLYEAYQQKYQQKQETSMYQEPTMKEIIIESNKFRKQIIYDPKPNFRMISDASETLTLLYKYQSLFMIKHSKKQLYPIFTTNLTEKKIKFVSSCPFSEYRVQSNKIIAVISHQDSFENIYSISEKLGNNVLLAVYPFIKIVEISKEKYNKYLQIFTSKYGQKLKPFIEQLYGFDSCNVYLSFKGQQESIFTFIVLEGMTVRCQFLKKSKFQEITKKKQN